MALLVGIDEAGYGPHLGPLVVSAVALEFPADDPPDANLWPAMRQHVCKAPARRDRRVVVCDSKAAYGSRGDLAVLERTVLGFLAASGARPLTLADLLAAVCVGGTAGKGNPPAPWDRPESLTLPAATSPQEVEAAADRLSRGLEGVCGRPAGLWVAIAHPSRLNGLLASGMNKAQALFALAADLLAEARRRSTHHAVHVTMDRHGGRRYYAQVLSCAFPMTQVETLDESPGLSRYRLGRAGLKGRAAPMIISVRDGCETSSLPTALASMAAKYIRELHMMQMNGYFSQLVPGLRPTAGYGLDAWRFLHEVAAARAAAQVPDALILRNR